MLDSKDQFSGIETSLFLCEAAFFSHMVEQVSSIQIIQHEIESLRSLESEVEFDYEWVAHLSEYLALLVQMMNLLLQEHLSLLDHLHGKVLTWLRGLSRQPSLRATRRRIELKFIFKVHCVGACPKYI